MKEIMILGFIKPKNQRLPLLIDTFDRFYGDAHHLARPSATIFKSVAPSIYWLGDKLSLAIVGLRTSPGIADLYENLYEIERVRLQGLLQTGNPDYVPGLDGRGIPPVQYQAAQISTHNRTILYDKADKITQRVTAQVVELMQVEEELQVQKQFFENLTP